MNEPNPFWHYSWIGLAAFCGVLARAARWTTPEGAFDWRKAVFECLTAPAIGFMTSAFGLYVFGPNVDPVILGGIAALFGLLGPAAIEALATNFFNAKIGAG